MLQLVAWKIGANLTSRRYFLLNFFVSFVTSKHLRALAEVVCVVSFVISEVLSLILGPLKFSVKSRYNSLAMFSRLQHVVTCLI
jgi:hypothetical protein